MKVYRLFEKVLALALLCLALMPQKSFYHGFAA